MYQAEGFLDKNRHFLAPEVIQLLRASQVDAVRYLFQCPITKTGNLYSPSPTTAVKSGTNVSKKCKLYSVIILILSLFNFKNILSVIEGKMLS